MSYKLVPLDMEVGTNHPPHPELRVHRYPGSGGTKRRRTRGTHFSGELVRYQNQTRATRHGSYGITAKYSGDGAHSGSASNTVDVVVD